MAASMRFGSIFKVSGSMSTNTGVHSAKRTQVDDETKLKGVVITSLPSSIPTAFIQRWRPDVPLFTATASRAPVKELKPASNSRSLGPSERDGLSSTDRTACLSTSVIQGEDNGICISSSGEI